MNTTTKKYQDLETERQIIAMLKQNTGASFLDSGGAYGRHWERNQSIDFEKTKPVTLEFNVKHNELTAEISLYHWLLRRVSYELEMDERWKEYDEARPDDSWNDSIPGFIRMVSGKPPLAAGAQHRNYHPVYTYNDGNCLLSQNIQFVEFSADNISYVMLQVHNGCDARGGMTSPKVFQLCDYDYSIYDTQRCSLWSRTDRLANQLQLDGTLVGMETRTWFTEDGSHWGSCDNGINLEAFDFTEDEERKGKGAVYVDSNGVGYCPIFGTELVGYID